MKAITTARQQSPYKRSSHVQIKMEVFFRRMLIVLAALIVLLVVGIAISLIWGSLPSIKSSGFKYFTGKVWDPVNDIYGGLPFMLGTLITSFIGLIISLPFSFSIALFLGEYSTKGWLPEFLKNIVELIAAVPSVIYGFWGFLVLTPFLQNLEMKLPQSWNVPPYGLGILNASLILSIMIIPYGAAMGREVIKLVPGSLKEGAYSLGATRWEVIKSVILPYTKSGLFAGVLLSLGRALGETMAVTMVIGNTNDMPTSIFSLGNTMASVIASQFTEADHTLYLSALIELGLLLFIITVTINMIGKTIISKFSKE